jgi:hypothetical protein
MVDKVVETELCVITTAGGKYGGNEIEEDPTILMMDCDPSETVKEIRLYSMRDRWNQDHPYTLFVTAIMIIRTNTTITRGITEGAREEKFRFDETTGLLKSLELSYIRHSGPGGDRRITGIKFKTTTGHTMESKDFAYYHDSLIRCRNKKYKMGRYYNKYNCKSDHAKVYFTTPEYGFSVFMCGGVTNSGHHIIDIVGEPISDNDFFLDPRNLKVFWSALMKKKHIAYLHNKHG